MSRIGGIALSAFPDHIRAAVVDRANGACEYCMLPAEGQIAPFPIDHVWPRSEGGPTVLDNLALACPHCNGRKWAAIDELDPESGERVALFNPRTQVWSDHFQWSDHRPLEVEGKTACGRATIARLQMNHPHMLAVRRLVVQLGVLRITR
jgi:hypothetical protein